MPSPRMSITESWDPGTRQRIAALTEANRAVTDENVQLLRDLAELQRRVARARKVCELWVCDLIPSRVLNILNGEET